MRGLASPSPAALLDRVGYLPGLPKGKGWEGDERRRFGLGWWDGRQGLAATRGLLVVDDDDEDDEEDDEEEEEVVLLCGRIKLLKLLSICDEDG